MEVKSISIGSKIDETKNAKETHIDQCPRFEDDERISGIIRGRIR